MGISVRSIFAPLSYKRKVEAKAVPLRSNRSRRRSHHERREQRCRDSNHSRVPAGPSNQRSVQSRFVRLSPGDIPGLWRRSCSRYPAHLATKSARLSLRVQRPSPSISQTGSRRSRVSYFGGDGSEVLAIRRQARTIQVLRARENRNLFRSKIQDLNGYLLPREHLNFDPVD